MSNETLEIEELLFQISRLMKRKMVTSKELGELSVLHIQTLMFLKDSDGATMSDIAEFLHIELPSATSLVNKLVRKNLAKRSSDKEDRRVVKIDLTETGTKLLVKAIDVRTKKLEQLLSYLSVDQVNNLLTILRTVKDHLEN